MVLREPARVFNILKARWLGKSYYFVHYAKRSLFYSLEHLESVNLALERDNFHQSAKKQDGTRWFRKSHSTMENLSIYQNLTFKFCSCEAGYAIKAVLWILFM